MPRIEEFQQDVDFKKVLPRLLFSKTIPLNITWGGYLRGFGIISCCFTSAYRHALNSTKYYDEEQW